VAQAVQLSFQKIPIFRLTTHIKDWRGTEAQRGVSYFQPRRSASQNSFFLFIFWGRQLTPFINS
jgi:hypothetical protein